MGDRANVLVKNGDSRVYLYTHWNGYALPDTLQSALKRGRERWGDGAYLARIIFCEMVKDEVMETTGYGISSVIGDNSYDILTVDCVAGTVTLESEEGAKRKGAEWKFAKYCELPLSDHEDLWGFLASGR